MGEKSEIRVKFEIGEIKFEAEGSAELVERERSIFTNSLLPSAVEAIVRTRNIAQNAQYTDAIEQAAAPTALLEGATKDAGDNVFALTPASDLSRTSLASFVKSKGADAHYDFILCAVYFNEKKNHITSFSSVTIRELYSEAKKPLPNNLSMSLSELVKKGYIMENPAAKGSNPKEYILTSDGETIVNDMQPKEKKPPVKARKSRPKEKSIYSDINCDELNLSNYPDVRALKSFKEKMILILYIVTNEGKGEWFTTADVVCIMTDIFGEAATQKQVDGVFRREKRWFKSENIDGNNKLVHRKLLNEAKSFAQSLGSVTE